MVVTNITDEWQDSADEWVKTSEDEWETSADA